MHNWSNQDLRKGKIFAEKEMCHSVTNAPKDKIIKKIRQTIQVQCDQKTMSGTPQPQGLYNLTFRLL